MDGVIAYDPMGASYAFSPIGWSGLTAGAGDTEDARYTTSVKYRIDTGMLRAGALYQFGGYDLNNGTQHAFEATVGGDANFGSYGKLSVDAIYTQDIGAVSLGAAGDAGAGRQVSGHPRRDHLRRHQRDAAGEIHVQSDQAVQRIRTNHLREPATIRS